MLELFSGLSGDEIVLLFCAAGGVILLLVLGLTGILVFAWLRHRGQELAAGIIQEMLDQGLPADQIERVLKAAGLDAPSARQSPLERLWERRSRAAQRSPAAPSARDV